MIDQNRGFAIAAQVFGRAEMATVGDAIAAADLPRTKAGTRHALRVPAIRSLATQPDLVNLAAAFVGPKPVPFRATLFDKSVASNWLVAWHQDTALPLRRRFHDASWGPWSIKAGVLHAIAPASVLARVVALRVHLDDSTSSNGPLRILPGSHSFGVLTHDDIQHLVGVVPAVECLCAEGGVVAMRPLVVHASSKARDGQPRRVLHIEYVAAVHLGPTIELAVG